MGYLGLEFGVGLDAPFGVELIGRFGCELTMIEMTPSAVNYLARSNPYKTESQLRSGLDRIAPCEYYLAIHTR